MPYSEESMPYSEELLLPLHSCKDRFYHKTYLKIRSFYGEVDTKNAPSTAYGWESLFDDSPYPL
jgi:hypothetical protein